MKKIVVCLSIMFLTFISMSVYAQKSFYDFTVLDISGEEFELAQLQGKKVLVVNTAEALKLAQPRAMEMAVVRVVFFMSMVKPP